MRPKKASVDPPAQEAELVALHVGQPDPRRIALPDVYLTSSQNLQPLEFLGLVAAGRVHVDVHADAGLAIVLLVLALNLLGDGIGVDQSARRGAGCHPARMGV